MICIFPDVINNIYIYIYIYIVFSDLFIVSVRGVFITAQHYLSS